MNYKIKKQKKEFDSIKRFDIDKLFHKLSKEKKLQFKLNLEQKINNKDKQFKKLLTRSLGEGTIIEKPDSLEIFEKQLKTYFFGKKGLFTNLIPNLRKELIKKEQTKLFELDEKIPIGDLTFFYFSEENKNLTLEERRYRNVLRKKIMNSSNFSRSNKFNLKKNINSENKYFLSENNENKKKTKIILSSPIQKHKHNNKSNELFITGFPNNESSKNKKKNYNHFYTSSFSFKKNNNNFSSSHNSLSSFNFDKINSPLSEHNLNLRTLNSRDSYYKNKINKTILLKKNNKNEINEGLNIKKTLLLDSYIKMAKTKESINNEIKNNNFNFFNKKNINEIKQKIEEYSIYENKLSKSLFSIINKNKIDKEISKLKKDIEVVFDQQLHEEKKMTMEEMLRNAENQKIDENRLQKNEILNAIHNSSNNQLTNMIKHEKIKKIPKGRDLEEEMKIRQFILEKENKDFSIVRNQFIRNIDIIKKMRSKIYSDNLKLEQRFEKNKNEAQILLINQQIQKSNYQKKK